MSAPWLTATDSETPTLLQSSLTVVWYICVSCMLYALKLPLMSMLTWKSRTPGNSATCVFVFAAGLPRIGHQEWTSQRPDVHLPVFTPRMGLAFSQSASLEHLNSGSPHIPLWVEVGDGEGSGGARG